MILLFNRACNKYHLAWHNSEHMTVQLLLRCPLNFPLPPFGQRENFIHQCSAHALPNLHQHQHNRTPAHPAPAHSQSHTRCLHTTHSPIHIFYVLFTLPACAVTTAATTTQASEGWGKPRDVTGEMQTL